jgi:hypothetical protein
VSPCRYSVTALRSLIVDVTSSCGCAPLAIADCANTPSVDASASLAFASVDLARLTIVSAVTALPGHEDFAPATPEATWPVSIWLSEEPGRTGCFAPATLVRLCQQTPAPRARCATLHFAPATPWSVCASRRPYPGHVSLRLTLPRPRRVPATLASDARLKAGRTAHGVCLLHWLPTLVSPPGRQSAVRADLLHVSDTIRRIGGILYNWRADFEDHI